MPTSVAFHYKGKAMTTQSMGDELRVAAVLTGRVTQRGDELTVGVELDDVRQRKQLWGMQYKRKLVDLLAVQRDIASEVSQRLRSQLSGEDQQKLTRGSTDDPAAFQLDRKGICHASKYTKNGFRNGVGYFNQALAVDPNYALAYGGLAFSYINSEDWFWPPRQATARSGGMIGRSLAQHYGITAAVGGSCATQGCSRTRKQARRR